MKRNKNTIFSYMLFLRVTPFFPNWFINLASPHVGVPLREFFVATFIGARARARTAEATPGRAQPIGRASLAARLVGPPTGVITGVVPLSIIPIVGGVSIQSLKDWSEITLLTKEWPYVNLQILGVVTVSAVLSLVPVFASQSRKRFA